MEKKVYAYDFFDTIVHRDCHPEKILFQWSKEMANYLNLNVTSEDIYQIRKKTEKILKSKDGYEEIAHKELIKKIFDEINIRDINFDEMYKVSYELELKIERNHIYIDEECKKDIINHYSRKDRIIIISDFYNGKEFIKDILKYFNMDYLFEDIYVSSDLNKRKSTGNLYKYVLSSLNIEPENLNMMGDNYISDFSIPQKLGINAICKRYNDKHFIETKKSLSKKVKKILFSNINKNVLSGYAGEFLYFISKLYKTLHNRNVKKVLFCSREGQILKNLFDRYQIKTYGEKIIDSEYFYVSRKATILPSLKEFNEETFNMIFRQFKQLKLKDFLKSIGFADDEIIDVSNNIKSNQDDYITIDDNNELYTKLKNNKNFVHLYNKKRTIQKSLFISYLKSLGYSLDCEKIFIVDIGWKGTIQDCIQEIIPNDCTVEGYYLGLRTKEFGCINIENKHGMLFSDTPNPCKNYSLLEHNYLFYERICAADHGPVLGYYSEEGKILPIINNNRKEMLLYEYIKPFQNNLVKTFDKLIDIYSNSVWEPQDLYEVMIKNFLWKQCVYFPQIWSIEKKARSISRENFGDISKNDKRIKSQIGKKQMEKKDLLFVDYTFRILDKYHLKVLYPLAGLYCRIVYLIKLIRLDKKNEGKESKS